MASPLLIDYLNRCRAIYRLHSHAAVDRSSELAQQLRIPPRWLVKPVLVRADGTLTMVLVPADVRLALDALRHALTARRVELAPERSFARRFPRCEPGAIPPVGHLFGLNAYAVPLFDGERPVYFCAGSRSESVEMPFAEFRRLAHFDEIALSGSARGSQSPLLSGCPRRQPSRVREPLHRPVASTGCAVAALQGW